MAGKHVLTANLINETDEALVYADNNDTWTILAGLAVVSLSDEAIVSGLSWSKLINYGTVVAPESAVDFEGDNASVTNAASGNIIGEIGVVFGGTGGNLVNHGTVQGINVGVWLDGLAASITINNTGKIIGSDGAVYVLASDGGLLKNSGVIQGSVYAIYVETDLGARVNVTNSASGRIQATYALASDEGPVTLTNRGKVVGVVDFNAAAAVDVINNTGNISGVVFLGPGGDRFNGATGRSGEILGEDGDDRLFAGKGNDIVRGGNNNDRLGGGIGNDVLEGGAGTDTFFSDPGRDNFHLYLQANPALDDFSRDIIRYTSLTHAGVTPATHDIIWGFHGGNLSTSDRIDFSAIDANGNAPGNGKFKIVAGFTAARGEIVLTVTGGNTLVRVDGDNDTAVDLTILVRNVTTLSGVDFIL